MKIKREIGASLIILAIAVSACTIQQQPTQPPIVATAPARPLPFTGRLVEGDPTSLPPTVAMSLSPTSAVKFAYHEHLTHDEYHIPLFITALDPVTYAGAPLGDYGVTAFATLSITDGDNLLGDYTAKAYVSKSYSLYSQIPHNELEEAARNAVREKMDQKLDADSSRLSQAFAALGGSTAGKDGK